MDWLSSKCLNYIVFGYDVIFAALVSAEYGSVLSGDERTDPFQRCIEGNNGIGLFEHFADLFAFDIGAIAHHAGEERSEERRVGKECW